MNGQPYYPITAAYSSTVHKVMGQDMEHVTLALETRVLPPAVGYVALTRVRNLDCNVPMLKLRKNISLINRQFSFFIVTSLCYF